jgi:hypothetical protein
VQKVEEIVVNTARRASFVVLLGVVCAVVLLALSFERRVYEPAGVALRPGPTPTGVLLPYAAGERVRDCGSFLRPHHNSDKGRTCPDDDYADRLRLALLGGGAVTLLGVFWVAWRRRARLSGAKSE